MASGSLPKSPVRSSLCDEVPHIFIRKMHLQPREFLISSGKGLLQHNRHDSDKSECPLSRRYWGMSGPNSDIANPALMTHLRHTRIVYSVVVRVTPSGHDGRTKA